MEKTLWLDTETTGLYSQRNALIELAAIIEIDGDVKDEFSIQFRPHEGAHIAPKALEVNGRSEEEIMSFQPIDIGILSFKKRLEPFVDKYNPADKFVPAGYNIPFDLGFIRAAFTLAGDKFGIGSWCFSCPIDVWSSVGRYILKTGIRLPNYKLSTVCGYFDIMIDAHNPISDIAATRNLYYTIEAALDSIRTEEDSGYAQTA